jgi:prophage antirepressor-like protein
LGYANTKQEIRVNVYDDDKKKMEELGKLSDSSLDANAQNSIFIHESGVYFLILRSEKPEAKTFK